MIKAVTKHRLSLAVRWRAEVARHDQVAEDLLQEALAGAEGLVERAAKTLGLTRGAMRRQLERYPKAAELVAELRARNGYTTGRLGRRDQPVGKTVEKPAAAAHDDEAPPRF